MVPITGALYVGSNRTAKVCWEVTPEISRSESAALRKSFWKLQLISIDQFAQQLKVGLDHLQEQAIRAVALNRSHFTQEVREAEYAAKYVEADFVFTTPERILLPECRNLFRRFSIDLFVGDEAHCVRPWGHDFRPDYLSLGPAIDELGQPHHGSDSQCHGEILDGTVRELRSTIPRSFARDEWCRERTISNTSRLISRGFHCFHPAVGEFSGEHVSSRRLWRGIGLGRVQQRRH